MVRAAHELLTSGLKSQSQADVASALQAFFNLNTLRQVCLGTVEAYASDLGVALKSATDSRQLGGLVGQVSAPSPCPFAADQLRSCCYILQLFS